MVCVGSASCLPFSERLEVFMPMLHKRCNRLLIQALIAGSALAGCSKPDQAAAPERAVRTQIVAIASSGGRQEFAAEVRARTESRLAFRVPGKLVQRRVNLGDAVKAGQLLAQLDPQDLKLAQDAAKANQVAAQANYDLNLADYKRARDLHEQGFVSSADLERRITALKAAQSALGQARVQTRVQNNQADYAVLQADVDGVVTGVEAEPGGVVAAGQTIVRVAQNGARDVVFAVTEDRVAQFRAAAAIDGALKVRLWGVDSTLYDAKLREVSASADPSTRTFQVKAELQSPVAKLGQTATVLLDLPKLSDVIKLPLSAVMEFQGKSAVWVLEPKTMTVNAQTIAVHSADGNEVVIADGLRAGQEVVTAGVHALTPGQKVKRYLLAGSAASPAKAASH
jgi:RND family efflux transporter MFP subunit